MIVPKHLLQRHLYLLSSKRAIQKSAGARSDLIDNERIVKLQRIYRREIERLCKDFQTGERTFSTADAKLYVPVVTLSTQDNSKLLQGFTTCFKRTITWNKYQSKMTTQTQKQYLDYLIDPSFQEVNNLFVLSI